MSHYSDKDKRKVKDLILSQISQKLDEALLDLETSYTYDPFRHEVWIDSFCGKFELHFTPANEMNGGKNYHLNFTYWEHGK